MTDQLFAVVSPPPHTTNKRDEVPRTQRDSNTRFQQSSIRRRTATWIILPTDTWIKHSTLTM